jgi:two-component system chemotaxis response regulator CheY
MLLAEQLRAAGYEVDEAPDGVCALERLEAAPLPAAIITDLAMPRMTGHELIDALHASPAWSDIPIIAVSGTERPRKGVRFLAKPLRVAALVAMLQTISLPSRSDAGEHPPDSRSASSTTK